MSPYIVNLTNHLISTNRYDDANHSRLPDKEFIKHVAIDLCAGDAAKMKCAKLGEIMASFESGDVMATKEALFRRVYFAGDCEDMLRQLVSVCLAYAICGRLKFAKEFGLPAYIHGCKPA